MREGEVEIETESREDSFMEVCSVQKQRNGTLTGGVTGIE